MAGRRVSRILFWLGLIVAIIPVAPKVLGAIDALALRFQGAAIDVTQAITQLTTLGFTFIAALLTLGIFLALAIPLGFFFGITLEMGPRNFDKIDKLCIRLEPIVE